MLCSFGTPQPRVRVPLCVGALGRQRGERSGVTQGGSLPRSVVVPPLKASKRGKMRRIAKARIHAKLLQTQAFRAFWSRSGCASQAGRPLFTGVRAPETNALLLLLEDEPLDVGPGDLVQAFVPPGRQQVQLEDDLVAPPGGELAGRLGIVLDVPGRILPEPRGGASCGSGVEAEFPGLQLLTNGGGQGLGGAPLAAERHTGPTSAGRHLIALVSFIRPRNQRWSDLGISR